jgi:hypothetical protein
LTTLTKNSANTTIQNKSKNTALQTPEYLKTLAAEFSLGNIDSKDLLIPRLCVANALSPQLKKGNEKRIEDLEEGLLFNNVTGKIYGEKIHGYVLSFSKNYIEFKPMEEGGGIIKFYGPDEKPAPADLAYDGDAKPKVTEFWNFLFLMEDDELGLTPIFVSYKSTGITRCAKPLLANVRFDEFRSIPPFGYGYTLQAAQLKNAVNEWFDRKGVKDKEKIDPEQAELIASISRELLSRGVKMDMTDIAEEGDTTTAPQSGSNFNPDAF